MFRRPDSDPATIRLQLQRLSLRIGPPTRRRTSHSVSVRNLDIPFYTTVYVDLAHLDASAAARHYATTGSAEDRWPNAEVMISNLETKHGRLPHSFQEDEYKRRHPDVARQFPFHRGGAYHYLRFGRYEGRSWQATDTYDDHRLHLLLNRVYDLPEVVVRTDEPKRINVLVPAFDFSTMSAGFFGVFQVARFTAALGYRVRLVMFDNFYWDEGQFREKLRGYPGMEELFDELEVDYIGERSHPLVVSPHDTSIATVWYSAYFARKIQQLTDSSRRFLYLIQDYETDFFPGSSLRILAEESYGFDYNALVSSESLYRSLLLHKPGKFASRRSGPKAEYFNNACSSRPPQRTGTSTEGVNRLAFYSRPQVNRNVFELGALSLIEAARRGVFDDTWEFYGVGIGDLEIELAPGRRLQQLPRMNLRDYQEMMSRFDIGLCLMASPHPSLLPFDLGGAGAIVVTNQYGTKTQRYFDRLCRNVIAVPPTLSNLVDGLEEAVLRSTNMDQRVSAAAEMSYPREWSETWSDKHVRLIRATFGSHD